MRSLQGMAKPISFARGAPSLDIVDVEGLRAAADRAFTEDPGGHDGVRDVGRLPAAARVDRRAPRVDPEQVLVTNGSMQADAFLFDALVEPGDTVIVERPTYDRTLLSLRSRGADVRMVELEPDGIDVAALERVLSPAPRRSSRTSFRTSRTLPATPCRPTSASGCWSSLATHEFTVFEDDPYVALRFEGEPLPTMLSMDGDSVVYASSFSKTVCPGIRVGYLVGPEELIARIAKIATSTYISPNMVSQGIVNEFCRSGAIERSIETVKAALRERAQTLCDALQRSFPTRASSTPRAATSCGSTCRAGPTSTPCSRPRPSADVQFVKGSDFVLEGAESSLRLAYSGVTPAEIEEGIRRLAEAYRELTATSTADAA